MIYRFIKLSPYLIILPLLVFSFSSKAQYTLRFEILSVPAPGADSVYVAGNFNSWNPKMPAAIFSREKDKLILEIHNLPKNIFEFKFTRGGWDKVETTKEGGDITNHLVNLLSDTVVQYRIAAWRDAFPQVSIKRHTASANVHILDSSFAMPQLKRTRKIWIYLPNGYEKSKKKYPVLYMHDGQNDFDEYTAGFGEWGVDECVDSLIKKGSPASIIVGIENGPQRMNEYNPFDFERFGKGEGDQYLGFIVNTLKPFIDKNYRTLKNAENTIIAGSSMGGLISYYAILKYPKVFGKAGIFSPAFWTAAPAIYQWTDSLAQNINAKLFFYMGDMEGDNAVQDMFTITEKLGKNSNSMIYTITDPEGRHNEVYWRKWFAEFYRWITADGYNSVIKKGD
ncbi:MAG TPA: alpha/beta hydrolase-fold protein [Ferruginibacter sp.]|nr:alpha/beta hydrolase-fold protein [Ferruginibacter sp.]